MNFDRIVLATKPTRLEELLHRHHSASRVAFFLESRGEAIEEYADEHDRFHASLDVVQRSLPRELPMADCPRAYVSQFLFRPKDLVIAVGPDGLFVNIAKYLDGQPMLTINPDPKRIDGILMRFRPEEVKEIFPRLLSGSYQTEAITLAKAETNDGQTLFAVNDFLVGRLDQRSSRYRIEFGGKTEHQSSSGVLISTGTGSTGWIKSVVAGASALTDAPARLTIPFARNARHLLFVVREPWQSRATEISVSCGQIDYKNLLAIISEMSEGGAIVSDGVLEDAIAFDAGAHVTISVAEKAAHLIIP